MEFEWDPEKEAKNIAKHGISFSAAARVLGSSGVFAYESGREGERRWVAVGLHPTRHRVVAVVYALREERIRIISARRARDHEEAEYHRRVAQAGSGGGAVPWEPGDPASGR